MSADSTIQSLHALRRTFGRSAAAEKLRLLAAIEALPSVAARDVMTLQATLDFIRAYPENAAVRRRCAQAIKNLRARMQRSHALAQSSTLENSGVPASVHRHPYSYATVEYLAAHASDYVEIDWDEIEDDARITNVLEMLLTGAENESMEDVQMWWAEWAAHVRPAGFRSDLEFLLALFRRSRFSVLEQANLYEMMNLQIRYELGAVGSGRCEVELTVGKVAYQKRDLAREHLDLEAEIRAPLAKLSALPASAGRQVIDVAMRALASRNLEIHPLTHASPRDVLLFEAQRGIQIALTGVVPEHRGTFAALYFFLVLKNGTPIAYGPASPFLGSCEMGINLFPEFRGGEIRFVYSQVMRLLHNALGVEHFYLTSYGMGEGNEEAIQSGAFWFYRRLGFSASNPDVEALARQLEKRMQTEPGYRTGTRMLRRLSATEAHLDLSNGHCRRFPYGRLSLAVSRFIAQRFNGDRVLATRDCTREISRILGPRARTWREREQRVLREFAIVLCMIDDFPRWDERDKTEISRIIEGKAARSEAAAGIRMKKHRRFSRAMFELAATS